MRGALPRSWPVMVPWGPRVTRAGPGTPSMKPQMELGCRTRLPSPAHSALAQHLGVRVLGALGERGPQRANCFQPEKCHRGGHGAPRPSQAAGESPASTCQELRASPRTRKPHPVCTTVPCMRRGDNRAASSHGPWEPHQPELMALRTLFCGPSGLRSVRLSLSHCLRGRRLSPGRPEFACGPTSGACGQPCSGRHCPCARCPGLFQGRACGATCLPSAVRPPTLVTSWRGALTKQRPPHGDNLSGT